MVCPTRGSSVSCAIGSSPAPSRSASVEHRTAPDFLPVVILRVDPEHGDGRHVVVAFVAARELQRGERLQQREQRTAENAGLLTCEYRDRRGIGQARGGGARAGRRVPLFLLCREDGSDPRAIARVLLCPLDGLAPRLAIHRVARVESLDLLEVVRVVAGERPNPREAADIEPRGLQAASRAGGHRGRGGLGRHGLVLSQRG